MAPCLKRRRLRKRVTIDWSSLPGELLQLIADKLAAVEDFVALTSVCRYFSFAVKNELRPPWAVFQPPWLLLPSGSNDDETCALSMYKKKKFKLDLPELHGRHCFGTPYGWIITLGLDLQLHLFNPLNRRRIALPPLKVGPYSSENLSLKRSKMRLDFHRAILIKRPRFGVDEFIVVACTVDGGLSVMRPEENTWETVKLDVYHIEPITDIAYYEGQVYVVGRNGRVLICSNMNGPGPLIEAAYLPDNGDKPRDAETDYFYLLESMGDLLLVGRKIMLVDGTSAFNVFKLDPQTKKWTAVDNLGNRAMFLSDSQSISLSSPETFNCRSNCIYYAEDYILQYFKRENQRNMGVFDLQRRKIRPFIEDNGSLADSFYANWFIPTFS